MRRYKRKRIKRTPGQLAWRKLYLENWRICHDIVDLYVGHHCVVCGSLDRLDLDHCFSRACKMLFYDINNLNYLCKSHHYHKTHLKGNWVDKEVDNITLKRAGKRWWEKALVLSKQSCGEWKLIDYQQKMNRKLKRKLAAERKLKENGYGSKKDNNWTAPDRGSEEPSDASE